MTQTHESRPRLRDVGITIGELPPGPLNAITDVPGLRVGHTTIIAGEGPLRRGVGPVRTGVTAVWPHAGNVFEERVTCATQVLNGAGEMTGRAQIDEWGVLESPILLTNTHSVGAVYDATVAYMADHDPHIGPDAFVIPVVAECFDGFLNDTAGGHVRREHVYAALDSARGGPVQEGAVGAGTGMACFQFKGGIGTASRRVEIDGHAYTVGMLTLCNFGTRRQLTIAGVPVGRHITDLMPVWGGGGAPAGSPEGSIILVAATDAPLLERQLGRICRRAILGLARTGSTAGHTSGDLLIAFSTASCVPHPAGPTHTATWLADEVLDPLFAGTVEAAEEAIINALCAATTTTGRDDNILYALPVERLPAIMRTYGRLTRERPHRSTQASGR
jgi:D-aminopeptidase